MVVADRVDATGLRSTRVVDYTVGVAAVVADRRKEAKEHIDEEAKGIAGHDRLPGRRAQIHPSVNRVPRGISVSCAAPAYPLPDLFPPYLFAALFPPHAFPIGFSTSAVPTGLTEHNNKAVSGIGKGRKRRI